jgi:NAD(P)-dependent dehydrogenase (short-subunit alcohol dehydrogenase family)
MRLDGKVAIITGAGRGNGRGIALGLAREGAAVCVADIIGENAEQVAQEIAAAGGRAIAVRADITNPSDVQAMTDATVQAFGKITTLVNNAGIYPRTAFFDMGWDEWRQSIDVNLGSAFLVTLDHQPLLAGGRTRHRAARRLCRCQGRDQGDEHVACHDAGAAQHPRQCHSARSNPHGHEPSTAH